MGQWLRAAQAVVVILASLWLVWRMELVFQTMSSVEKEVQSALKYLDKIKPILDRLP